jgi:hypothetical protein
LESQYYAGIKKKQANRRGKGAPVQDQIIDDPPSGFMNKAFTGKSGAPNQNMNLDALEIVQKFLLKDNRNTNP